MRFLMASVRKEVRRLLRDPLAFALWVGIPFTIMILIHLAFGGADSGGIKPQGTLFIADHDNTLLSGSLKSAFGQGPVGEMFQTVTTSEAEGRRRMARGEGSALVIVPQGFQAELLRNRPVKLLLITNPAQQILPAVAAETLDMLSDGVRAIHLVAGDQLRPYLDSNAPPSDAQVASTSLAFYRIVKSLDRYLKPLLLEVEFAPEEKTPVQPFNLMSYLFPGLFFMAVLFLARGTSDDIWDEIRQGTLRRLRASGAPVATAIGAKLGAVLATGLAVSAVALCMGRWGMGVDVANWPAALAWLVASVGAWYLILLNLQLAAGAQNQGAILTSFVIFPSMMLGGSFFAFAMMPPALARIGRATPLGWMVERFDLILRGRATAEQVAWWLAAQAGVMVALFVLSGWNLRHRFLRG
jgi:ABC-type multidrug transport system permease subunit